ncbi:hypothetical protein QCN29_09845 [Streptomyces sp. HNM0663]|uniref:Uncharacterized protein n=1 Tax=Streptomyces chengmaiensis TaxID=3040919 RepID=A0ABT6HLF0_9ACTN|nr:hypothetical protein [Streptomyces chengmaiensis]MDH2389088.1 hypothetical protein [Streptomyces chengmaiensis]
MNEEFNDQATPAASSGFSGLLIAVTLLAILYFVGNWIHDSFFAENSKTRGGDAGQVAHLKPWWNGTAYQQVCSVHTAPEDTYCNIMAVTVQDERIATLVLPDSLGRNSESVFISANDCGKSDYEPGSSELEGALAGKGKRYCYIQELGGGREWQVNEL